MTRRKQNYPKRLKCAPSEEDASHGPADSGRENASPVATDDDDDDAEDDSTGDDETVVSPKPQPPTSNKLLASETGTDERQEPPTLGAVDVKCDAERETAVQSPKPVLGPADTGPLTSLSNMTVPATFGNAKSKDTVVSAVGKASLAKASSLTAGSSWHPDHTSPEGTCITADHVSSSPSRMASVIVPMASISRRLVASPEDKSVVDRVSLVSHTHGQQPNPRSIYEKLIAAAPVSASATVTGTGDDQPLDLSKKSSRPRSVSDPDPPTSGRVVGANSLLGLEREGAGVVNGKSSLESLQRRFGGDFALEQLRRPSSIIHLQSTVISSSALLRPLPPPTNGFSTLGSSSLASATYHHHHSTHNHHGHHNSSHHSHHPQGLSSTKTRSLSTKGEHLDKLLSAACHKNSNQSSSSASAPSGSAKKSPAASSCTEPAKKSDPATCLKTKTSSSGSLAVPGSSTNSTAGGASSHGGDGDSKYTIHRCSCQKTFGTLYALSAHLQETGHVPGSSKQASLMDYPKLVRGQDMWLNQESEQTRRILRCMQCGESFKSLPMLTVHMMQTQHYSKIVSADHGRRSHKCSAYCERELDRECIFKCKVCQDTYPDMEGLANHMIVSGHHKKQVLRSHNYPELGLRHKQRKRFLSDDQAGSTVASLLEYKRKYMGGSGGSNGYLSQVGQPAGVSNTTADNLISCEVCGKKIETHHFVEHIKACLKQKSEVIDALKSKLSAEENAACKTGGAGPCYDSLASCSTSSPEPSEQPLPSTKDSALFKRLELASQSSTASSDDKKLMLHKESGGGVEVEGVCEKTVACKDAATEPDRKESERQNCAKPQMKDEEGSRSKSPTFVGEGPVMQTLEEKSCDSDSFEKETSPDDKTKEMDATCLVSVSSETLAKETAPTASPTLKEEVRLSGDSAALAADEGKSSDKSPCPSTESRHSEDCKHSPPQSPLSSSQLSAVPGASVERAIKREFVERQSAEESDNVCKKIKLESGFGEEGEPNSSDPSMPPSEGWEEKKFGEQSGGSVSSKDGGKSLDIIDPNSTAEGAGEGGSSALKAMESFIQRSFSSKFDARRSSLSPMFSMVSSTTHLTPLLGLSKGVLPMSSSQPPASSTSSSLSHLTKFTRFFSSVPSCASRYLDISSDVTRSSFDKSVLSALTAKSAEILERNRIHSRSSTHSAGVVNSLKNTSEEKDKAVPGAKDQRGSENKHGDASSEENDEDRSSSQAVTGDGKDKEENLADKYLNPDDDSDDSGGLGKEGERGGAGGKSGGSAGGTRNSSGGKQSALDSLSSFVNGQPMTSEHPLDSLQKLLAKSDIPKMMAASAAAAHSLYNPHHPYLHDHPLDQIRFTPPDLPTSSSSSSLPLNLSLKPVDGCSGTDDDDDNLEYPADSESPSTSRDGDDGDVSSPSGAQGPDGELTDYKCTACSRRFASKGSYRYHLSRCHLSSVKKYGIKEAFNMSPYVYLPLDHTAKFTKYYQMAQELANKGK